VPLSLANGQQLLLDDLKYPGRYEGCVNAQVTYNLNANQFSALASFVFNLGCGNFGSSTLKTLLNQGNRKSLKFLNNLI
jgi:lysozyme